MAAQKPHINLVTIGHVDHGKSTLVGRLLFEHGEIPQHIIDDYRKQAEEKGKAKFKRNLEFSPTDVYFVPVEEK